MNSPVNLIDLDRECMETFFTNTGERSFRACQILQWIFQQGVTDFGQMTNLSLELRSKLPETTIILFPEIVSEQKSADGTHKWVMKIDEDNFIETVFIPEDDRGTLCISSQVGCPLDCSFCSTGKQGYNRNLKVSEIIGQLWVANNALGFYSNKKRIITNVVMMGMGEPLLNFENVLKAMNLMMDDLAYGLSRKRVTLSTAGVVPGIKKLSETSNVSLAISLHAANNKLRDVLVPLNKKYPLEELIPASRYYSENRAGEPVTFEYVMLDEINDRVSDAHELVLLLSGFPAKVNLIPFNPFPGTEYRRSPPQRIDQFRDILVKAGIITITRKTRGDDINAACGQLVGKVLPRARKHRLKILENRI